jgi:hypothetical protein
MTRDEDEEDTYLASHNLVGVLQHISRMERNLREGGWLEQKRELQYRFAGLSRTLGEYITDRRYEEFR